MKTQASDTEVLVPDGLRAPPKSGPRKSRYLLIALAVVGVWAATVLALVLLGLREARSGQKQLQAVEGSLSIKSLMEDRVLNSLQASSTSFDRAHNLVDNPVTAPARLLPVLGRQLRSLGALTESAAVTTSVATGALREARGLLEDPAPKGSDRIRFLRRLADLAEDARERLDDLDLGPSAALFKSLSEAREASESRVDRARDLLTSAVDFGTGFADFLEGPRSYVIAAANNAEMRAGSGMFLSLGLLQTSDGSLSMSEFIPPPTASADQGVSMDDPDIAARWGWAEPNREWRNLMLSPRFDANAEMAARMWEVTKGQTVDGVISVDIRALKALLGATGEIEVDGEKIDASNIERILLYEQYAEAELDLSSVEPQKERKERSGRIAGAALTRLEEGGWDPVTLVSEMSRAIDGRHLMAWSRLEAEHKAWEAAGMDGRLESDSLLISVNNRGANKLDQFLELSAELQIDEDSQGSDVTLSLVLHNSAAGTEPNYVLGDDPPKGAGRGVYSGFLAFTLPGRALEPRIVGEDRLAVGGPDGLNLVIGHQILIGPGESKEFTVRFGLPEAERTIRVEPSARIPPIRWQTGQTRWQDTRRREIQVR